MATIGWRFPPLSGGQRQGYTNNDIEAFRGTNQINDLVREICQNSLDAKRDGATGPVRVVFELKHIPAKKFKAFQDFDKCIEGCKEYWGDNMDERLSNFLIEAESMLSKETIPLLIASDYNTTGLIGSKSKDYNSPWEALAGADGVCAKNDPTSGGSFGIGKNAPFASSSLSMVFYNTYALDGEKAFIGVAKIATLFDEDKRPTQRVGQYQKNDDVNEKWTPIFQEDSDVFRDVFIRDELGTDIIIAGFNQEENWLDNMAKAAAKNFFVAIAEDKLIVELKDANTHEIINSSNIEQVITAYAGESSMTVTSQLFAAYTNPDYHKHLCIIEEGDAEIFIKSDSNFRRNIAHFRDTGMFIYPRRRQIMQRYAAVFIVRGENLSKLLRATEPPRHDKWDHKLITGTTPNARKKRANARKYIKKIEDTILELLRAQFEVAAEDTIDAPGIADYLPDLEAGLGEQTEGTDALRPKIKLSSVMQRKPPRNTKTRPGKKTKGESEEDGIVRGPGRRRGKRPNPSVHPGGQTEGAGPGEGNKRIIMPNLSKQRAFPINPEQGLYKIVIEPAETYNNLYVTCSARGEDGRSDALKMESFTYNGSRVTLNDNKAGPIKVEANNPATFFVMFDRKEKMVLNLEMEEVCYIEVGENRVS